MYCLQEEETGRIKIGETDDFNSRKRTHQTSNSQRLRLVGYHTFPTKSAAQAYEADTHERFAALKLDGEWFKPEPELVNHIRTYMRPPEPQNTDAVAHPELRRQLLAAIEALRRQVLVLTAGG